MSVLLRFAAQVVEAAGSLHLDALTEAAHNVGLLRRVPSDFDH
ncbi:MAG TPA: hypothetical protein VFZ10_10775 [Geminicoccaceae bacterium]